ncbi:hypothetical protein MVEN_01756500 [Mycena venus]|uniref:Uncharacterized protein n=1 Tax=Mycena venus TaxID=2733690 RepID=A0A8H6XKF7_9AGAR|nr:hypothetical protein MVEN_01756500 [Mycena venus]
MLSFLRGLFPEIPASAGMLVVPCSTLDIAQRDTVRTVGLVVDAHLDANKLYQTLSMLIERKFPRVGARLAYRNRVYEFHIPRVFDSETPPVAFTAEEYREPYLASCGARPDVLGLLNRTDSEPIFCQFPALKMYLVSKTCPASTDEFISTKTPMLHVHVSVFDDLTLIGVTASEMMFDAPGLSTLLHAWTRVLSGDDIDDIPGMAWDLAPFNAFLGPSYLRCIRGRGYGSDRVAEYPMNMWKGSVYDPLIELCQDRMRRQKRAREVSQLVRIPKTFIEDRRLEVIEELKRKGFNEIVSSSDVLMAWWIKTSYRLRRPNDPTVLYLHMAADLRPKAIFAGGSPLAQPFINNASSTVCVPSLMHEILATSLGELALGIRRTISAYDADLPASEELRWRNTHPMIRLEYCQWWNESAVQTSWSGLSGLDFSGAGRQGEKTSTQGRVRFVFTDIVMAEEGEFLRGSGAILMEDANAVWMSQVKWREEWEELRRSGLFKFV